jgi:hypothetical protein
LAIVGFVLEWEFWVVSAVLIIILIIGLVVMAIGVRESELKHSLMKLKQLSGYFNRRFMGDSSLSIFTIINSLFNIDNPKLWEWARSCDVSQRIFNSWGSSFINRVESETRTGALTVYLRIYLNELWLVISHYYEFVEQFHEIAESVEVPQETTNQYNRFVVEYNAFVQELRDNISKLRGVAKTNIEPASMNFAQELSSVE